MKIKMKKLTEHEAWTELATMMETMKTMPGVKSGRCDYPCYGLCSVLATMRTGGLISSAVYDKMESRVCIHAPEYGGNYSLAYRWPPGEWQPRAKFCRGIAKLTKKEMRKLK